jgi:MscS family membrane protein
MIPILSDYITNPYLRGLAVFVIFFFVLRVFLEIVGKIFLKISSKTKTDLDDILFEKSSSPFTLIAFCVSLLVTFPEFGFSERTLLILTNLVYSFLVIIFAYLFYVIVDLFVIRALKKFASKTKNKVDDSLISLFRSVLNIALIVISLLYVLSLWGVEIGPLLAGLGIAGLAVALALQPILSNIFSGAAMVLDGTVRAGDLVYLDQNTKGKIEKVGLRSTRIKTFDNELIIVPNNKLAESTIQNVAQPEPKSRAVVPFSVAYGADIEKVKKVVLKSIEKIEYIEDDPTPIVRFIEMANSSLNFKLYYYVNSFEHRFETIDKVNTAIYNALNKAGIEIPFPQMDVHLKK